MSQIRYICKDSCGFMVTVEEFKNGKNFCDKCNATLIRSEYCSRCNNTFEEGEDHICL